MQHILNESLLAPRVQEDGTKRAGSRHRGKDGMGIGRRALRLPLLPWSLPCFPRAWHGSEQRAHLRVGPAASAGKSGTVPAPGESRLLLATAAT
ncbi:hypothetical protein NDU88_004118 [Pleurodeles waltl]|uniref:Uncharacterized protein n=1 Tax=Pleurodeles waltl TaxID=8319 RepID=A0AAV7KYH8_PLEWA|nr:hypothetical protein NDU88_004118 [Pleurodeles waltl]